LASKIVDLGVPKEAISPCREFTLACLTDTSPVNRILAIRLAANAEIHLLERVTQLLKDPDPGVRRNALLAIGGIPEAIATDDLLASLHDPDPEARRLCEEILRGRGLSPEQVKLGAVLTDPDALKRLRVLEYLRFHSELEPGLWLRKLSHDPSPAVRAAAIRAAAEQNGVDITDRLKQLCQNDPSQTVRQVAQYYLSCRQRAKP
jgi:HEAT repeat protein